MGLYEIFIACKTNDTVLFQQNYCPLENQLLMIDTYFLTPLHYIECPDFFQFILQFPNVKKQIRTMSLDLKQVFVYHHLEIAKHFVLPTYQNLQRAKIACNIPLVIYLRKKQLKKLFQMAVKTIIKHNQRIKLFEPKNNESLGLKFPTKNTCLLDGTDISKVPTRLLHLEKNQYVFGKWELCDLNGVCPYTRNKIKTISHKNKIWKGNQSRKLLESIKYSKCETLIEEIYSLLDTSIPLESFEYFFDSSLEMEMFCVGLQSQLEYQLPNLLQYQPEELTKEHYLIYIYCLLKIFPDIAHTLIDFVTEEPEESIIDTDTESILSLIIEAVEETPQYCRLSLFNLF